MSERPNTMAANVARAVLLAIGMAAGWVLVTILGVKLIACIGAFLALMFLFVWAWEASATGAWWPFSKAHMRYSPEWDTGPE
jgi:hypothetical protein